MSKVKTITVSNEQRVLLDAESFAEDNVKELASELLSLGDGAFVKADGRLAELTDLVRPLNAGSSFVLAQSIATRACIQYAAGELPIEDEEVSDE